MQNVSVDRDFSERDAAFAADRQAAAEELALQVADALLRGVPRDHMSAIFRAGEAHAQTMPWALESAQETSARVGGDIEARVPAYAVVQKPARPPLYLVEQLVDDPDKSFYEEGLAA